MRLSPRTLRCSRRFAEQIERAALRSGWSNLRPIRDRAHRYARPLTGRDIRTNIGGPRLKER